MPARHLLRVPQVWLMTDERLGEGLWRALRCLPPGGGVVFRHYATPPAERRRLWLRVRRLAKARRQLAVSAGGLLPGAAGIHGRARGAGLRTYSAHDRSEAIAARRAGAAIVFVSPIFATRSHPGAEALAPLCAARVARGLEMKVIALGGMDARRWRQIRQLGFDGWAGIDAFRD